MLKEYEVLMEPQVAKLALAEEEEEAELVESEDKMETGPLEEELIEAS